MEAARRQPRTVVLAALLLSVTAPSAAARQPAPAAASTVARFDRGSNPIALSGPARPSRFMEASGRRAAFLGREGGSLEAWVYPLKVVHDFNLSFAVAAYAEPMPGASLARGGRTSRVQYRPIRAPVLHGGRDVVRPDRRGGRPARMLSRESDLYDPISYNNGAVWPFLTEFAALALYRNLRAPAAWAYLDGTADLTFLEARGYIAELFSGDRLRPLDAAVPHQLFATTGYVSMLLRGLLGLASMLARTSPGCRGGAAGPTG